MPAQTLEITTNGKYKNVLLKARKGVGGIEVGNYVIVEKTFVEGTPVVSKLYTNARTGEPSVSYSVRCVYTGEEISFWLNEAEHNAWKLTGGIGDKVKITMTEKTVLNKKTNVKMILPELKFELA